MLTTRRLLARLVQSTRRIVEEAGAIQPGTDLAEEFGSFGRASYMGFPFGVLYGLASIHIGEGTLIGKGVSLHVGYSPDDQDLPGRGLVVGDRCVIGAGSRISAHESIVIGDDVWFGSNVFVSDASHGYQDPETPIGRQLGPHRPVEIGAGSWLGHGAIVVPGTRIGRQVVVGAGTVVSGTVPDHSVLVGAPARIVRRLEPGVGWRTPDGTDVRPAWTTDEVTRMLAGELD